MSRGPRPIMHYTHDNLMHELNDAMIKIKLHHLINYEEHTNEQKEKIDKSRIDRPCPTYQEIIELMEKAYTILEKDQYSPIKY